MCIRDRISAECYWQLWTVTHSSSIVSLSPTRICILGLGIGLGTISLWYYEQLILRSHVTSRNETRKWHWSQWMYLPTTRAPVEHAFSSGECSCGYTEHESQSRCCLSSWEFIVRVDHLRCPTVLPLTVSVPTVLSAFLYWQSTSNVHIIIR